jgi:predicted RNase H-like nuclease (RuvC/YqgF family)
MNNTKTKQNFTTIAIVIIILLLLLNGYQWYSNNTLSKSNEVKQSEVIELQKLNAELDQDYQSAVESLEELRGDNQELNSLIDAQKAELTTQKNKINDLIWSKKELDKAKVELKNLNSSVTKYMAEIKELKEKNQILTDENFQLATKVDEVSRTNEEILTAKAALSKEKDELSKSNQNLGSKVDMANAIKVNFIEVKGYESNKKGKLSETSRAKNVNVLRVCFITETNMVTSSGQKRFYVRIIKPTGETVAMDDSGSGVLTNKLDNTQVRYTTAGDITYNNEDTNACIDWNVTDAMVKGNYQIELYNNGFPVGKGTFKLK